MLHLVERGENSFGLAVAWATLGEWKVIPPKYIAEHGETWNALDYFEENRWQY